MCVEGFRFRENLERSSRTLNFLENRLLKPFQKRSGGQTFNGRIDTVKTG
jgi:hypothetical protein